jgi:hypothetical protein
MDKQDNYRQGDNGYAGGNQFSGDVFIGPEQQRY